MVIYCVRCEERKPRPMAIEGRRRKKRKRVIGKEEEENMDLENT